MTKEELLQLLQTGEYERVELKRAEGVLPASVWETYSAFANTAGGVIVLGVSESTAKFFTITGVKNTNKLVKEFWNQINNPQKVNTNILFNHHVSIIDIDAKLAIVIEVPKANRQEKPVYINNNIMTGVYRRNADGDYRCSPEDIKAMLRDQAEVSADISTFEEIAYSKLLTETYRRYRIRFKNLKPNHSWNNLDDEEFLLILGSVRRLNNKLVPTLAGIVLFSNEPVITTVLPNFFLDYREKTQENDVRWIDRYYSRAGK